MWTVDEADLEPAALGAAVLGSGGGGNPYLGYLRARQALRAGRRIDVIDPTEVADTDLVVVAGGMGSPIVNYEKLPGGDEEVAAVRALEEKIGARFTAVAPVEMGGGNSMAPMVVAAELGVPLVDGDGMGRAFPQLQMTTYLINGVEPAPTALADERGNRVVITDVVDAIWLERTARAVTIELGGHCGLATSVMTGAQCRRSIVPNTLALALRVGRAILDARAVKAEPWRAVVDAAGGHRHLRGKVVDVERRSTGGFASGRLALEGSEADSGRAVVIEFQNENLVLWEDGRAAVTVPDLITLVASDSGEPLTTEVVRYGCRADVLALPCAETLRSSRALETVGPRAFGFDLDYVPLTA